MMFQVAHTQQCRRFARKSAHTRLSALQFFIRVFYPITHNMPVMNANQNNNPLSAVTATGDSGIVGITRNALGQLVAQIVGHDAPITDVRVARCFPWSIPDSYISIRSAEGKELALIVTLDELNPPSRAVVEQELHEKIFNPRIQRILDYNNEFGVVSIQAQTDRGNVTFQIRSRDDVRMLSPVRAIFHDADGNSYELHDISKMDALSRKLLHEYF